MSELGLLVPLAAIGAWPLAIWVKSKQRIAEMHLRSDTGASAEATAQLTRKTAELEERVRVLERIVTDGGYDLSTQIEALRRDDRPLPSPAMGSH